MTLQAPLTLSGTPRSRIGRTRRRAGAQKQQIIKAAIPWIAPCCVLLLSSLLSVGCGQDEARPGRPDQDFCEAVHRDSPKLSTALAPFSDRLASQTGVYVLEGGEDAMMARAWLSDAAEKTIDVQYFIFSADNVGLIAADYLLRAAERDVRVRVIVDDFLLSADAQQLLDLDAHENLSIKIYNPNVNVGKSLGQKLTNALQDFRGINQRMHNKTFIVDGTAVITGGRNIADEYFDYDHEYNFRDRDVLLFGGTAADVQASFEAFWNDPLSVSVGGLVERERPVDLRATSDALHQYACNPENFWPEVRDKIRAVPQTFETMLQQGRLSWVDGVRFVSDRPGKNDGSEGLGGGGATTDTLVEMIGQARQEVFIQTPYLVTTELARGVFAEAVKRGVAVTILTNSLASTDNLDAFSGYARDREVLLATGVEIYEWRPDAALRRSMMKSALTERGARQPVFAVHAKTMVVDESHVVIGTFNLDPRSANLNTECITVIPSAHVARQVLVRLRQEVGPDNAWRVTQDQNPDAEAGIRRRLRLIWRIVIPKSIL